MQLIKDGLMPLDKIYAVLHDLFICWFLVHGICWVDSGYNVYDVCGGGCDGREPSGPCVVLETGPVCYALEGGGYYII